MSKEVELKLIRKEAKTFVIDCECPKCNEGSMIGTNQMVQGKIDQSKIFIFHKCNKCGNILQIENIKYPKLDVIPIEDYEQMEKNKEKCDTCENQIEEGKCKTGEPEKCLGQGYGMWKEKTTTKNKKGKKVS